MMLHDYNMDLRDLYSCFNAIFFLNNNNTIINFYQLKFSWASWRSNYRNYNIIFMPYYYV